MFLFRFALDSPDEVHTSFIEVKLKCLSHRKPCKIPKNVTKLISVRKKSYTFSKYLMSSILEYIIHISHIFSFLL